MDFGGGWGWRQQGKTEALMGGIWGCRWREGLSCHQGWIWYTVQVELRGVGGRKAFHAIRGGFGTLCACGPPSRKPQVPEARKAPRGETKRPRRA
jgi:hypothetical protein